jgi:transposase-like protein
MSMVKCPYCGYEAEVDKFKLVRKPWKFRFYTVRMLECPKCHRIFNYYYGISPRKKKAIEFTIKVRPRG